jgi:ribulose-phosphate 3-epimerase
MKAAVNWFGNLPRQRLLAEFSLWSADLTCMADEMARVDPHVDLYHIDVSDGHFTPAFLFFPDLVAQCRKLTIKPLHIHLMVKDAVLLSQVDQFIDAGADLVSVHVENDNAGEAIQHIKSRGAKAGVVLQVDTSVQDARPLIDELAFLTLLGTRIGIKGQSLDPTATARLAEARAMIAGKDIILAADGGIRENTVPLLRGATANTIVMGSLAFNDPDLGARIKWVHAQ